MLLRDFPRRGSCPTDGYWSDDILDQLIVNFNFAVGQIEGHIIYSAQGISDGLADATLRQHLLVVFDTPFLSNRLQYRFYTPNINPHKQIEYVVSFR